MVLELLVVVAIIAIISSIAVPSFIGKIAKSKDSADLAEINSVEKAVGLYYTENGSYPTLQGSDVSLGQPQPIDGSAHNVDFSKIYPQYLSKLPHFSYWWVDYKGKVYHTQKPIGTVVANVFTPQSGCTYTLYKTDGSTQAISGSYTFQVGEYVLGKDDKSRDLPKISGVFKNEKMHPESGDIAVTGLSLNKSDIDVKTGTTDTLVATIAPATASNQSVAWSSSNPSIATVNSSGLVTGVGSGHCTITATSSDGGFTGSCTVTVSLYTLLSAYSNWTAGNYQGFLNGDYSTISISAPNLVLNREGGSWEAKLNYPLADASKITKIEVVLDNNTAYTAGFGISKDNTIAPSSYFASVNGISAYTANQTLIFYPHWSGSLSQIWIDFASGSGANGTVVIKSFKIYAGG